jgi:hypothetical protein
MGPTFTLLTTFVADLIDYDFLKDIEVNINLEEFLVTAINL